MKWISGLMALMGRHATMILVRVVPRTTRMKFWTPAHPTHARRPNTMLAAPRLPRILTMDGTNLARQCLGCLMMQANVAGLFSSSCAMRLALLRGSGVWEPLPQALRDHGRGHKHCGSIQNCHWECFASSTALSAIGNSYRTTRSVAKMFRSASSLNADHRCCDGRRTWWRSLATTKTPSAGANQRLEQRRFPIMDAGAGMAENSPSIREGSS